MEIILSFLLTLYMDILIFNVFKTVRHTKKATTTASENFKNHQDFKFCVIFRFKSILKTTSYSFREDLTFTYDHTNLIIIMEVVVRNTNLGLKVWIGHG